ncbi:MAG: hypothetical protein ABIH37_05540 [archaeon]
MKKGVCRREIKRKKFWVIFSVVLLVLVLNIFSSVTHVSGENGVIQDVGNKLLNIGEKESQEAKTTLEGGEETNVGLLTRIFVGKGVGLLDEMRLDPKSFTTLLMGILLWLLLYVIIDRMPLFSGSVWISGGVSFIIALLTLIYLPDAFMIAVGSEYAALGATILTVGPFLMMLWFTADEDIISDQYIARGIWFVMSLYYIVMFMFSYGFVVGDGGVSSGYQTWFMVGNDPAGTLLSNADASVYFYTLALLACAIMIFAIGPIRYYSHKGKAKAGEEAVDRKADEARAFFRLLRKMGTASEKTNN